MNDSVDQSASPAESTAATVVAAPLHAAKGNDDVMSTMPSVPQSEAEAKGMWKQRIGAAKIAWGKLTDDELLQVEGHTQKLAGLVQERYAITFTEAETQVKDFFAKHSS